jgi:hypothetical protein
MRFRPYGQGHEPSRQPLSGLARRRQRVAVRWCGYVDCVNCELLAPAPPLQDRMRGVRPFLMLRGIMQPPSIRRCTIRDDSRPATSGACVCHLPRIGVGEKPKTRQPAQNRVRYSLAKVRSGHVPEQSHVTSSANNAFPSDPQQIRHPQELGEGRELPYGSGEDARTCQIVGTQRTARAWGRKARRVEPILNRVTCRLLTESPPILACSYNGKCH